MCVRIQKSMSCAKNSQKFQKLQFQRLISLNVHHLCGTSTTLTLLFTIKIYTPKKSVFKRVLICDLFQKNQKGWVFHIHLWKKNKFEVWRMKIFSGFQFEKGVVVNQINIFDYSSIQNCVRTCHFNVLGGKLSTSSLNQRNTFT